jgi:hypothetical protein
LGGRQKNKGDPKVALFEMPDQVGHDVPRHQALAEAIS